MWYRDRADAGRRLARRLEFLRGQDVVVLAIPRGGVPVAFEAAAVLAAPLDVVMVAQPESPCLPELPPTAERYRASRPRVDVVGRIAVVVDDGAVTGAAASEACRAARALGAAKVVVALPVAPAETVTALAEIADDVICLSMPASPMPVGEWYEDFPPVPDGQIVELLTRAALPAAGDAAPQRAGRLPG